ncbi:MAG: hypothetical protein KC435_11225 [Thermomicrobiales bacterium]|nr:hypothetical protein [Thermomicrobiales bacterium]
MNRRVLLTHVVAAPLVFRQLAGTPAATPSASPVANPITITGEGTLRDIYGEDAFKIDVTSDGTTITGELMMEVHLMEASVYQIDSTEFMVLEPLSARSPHIKRLVGYATVNGSPDQPYVLELTDGRAQDEPDEVNLVVGLAAKPFLGQYVKANCDCGVSLSLRSTFVEGGLMIAG